MNNEGGVHFRAVLLTNPFNYFTVNFILIRCNCSEISDNDRSTCISLSVKWDDPIYGSSEYYLRPRLCSIRPNKSGLLGVNNFDRWQCQSVYCKILRNTEFYCQTDFSAFVEK